MPRTTDYAALLEKQKAELEEKLATLKKVDITALESKKAKHYEEIEKIDAEIADAFKAAGITGKRGPGASGGSKKSGIQVSANRLKEIFKEQKTKEISIRKNGLDAKQVKELVSANSDTFKWIDNGPQPKVALVKG